VSEAELQTLNSVLEWGGIALVVAVVAFLQIRFLGRGARLSRFAKRRGYRYFPECPPVPRHWRDLACLHAASKGRARHCVEGERGGRTFTAFDWHYELPSYGPEARAYMPMLLTGWVFWYLLPWIDVARDPVFSVAVVNFHLPPGAHTAAAKKAIAPWRAEFGAEASLVRMEDGLGAPAAIVDAVDRLNVALDDIARAASAPPATAA
jgi:hypothetical protein